MIVDEKRRERCQKLGICAFKPTSLAGQPASIANCRRGEECSCEIKVTVQGLDPTAIIVNKGYCHRVRGFLRIVLEGIFLNELSHVDKRMVIIGLFI